MIETKRKYQTHAASIIRAEALFGRQSKVGEEDTSPFHVTQDVLRLEIAMEDTIVVTEFDGIQELEKDVRDKDVVGEISLSLGDHAKQVSVWTKVEDDVYTGRIDDDVHERDDVGVHGCSCVEVYLAVLEELLAIIETGVVEALYGEPRPMASIGIIVVRRGCLAISGEIDNAVRTESKDFDELESAIVDPRPETGTVQRVRVGVDGLHGREQEDEEEGGKREDRGTGSWLD
jgi:hypothetical protein